VRDGSEVEVGKPPTVMIVCGIGHLRVYPIAQSIGSWLNSRPIVFTTAQHRVSDVATLDVNSAS